MANRVNLAANQETQRCFVCQDDAGPGQLRELHGNSRHFVHQRCGEQLIAYGFFTCPICRTRLNISEVLFNPLLNNQHLTQSAPQTVGGEDDADALDGSVTDDDPIDTPIGAAPISANDSHARRLAVQIATAYNCDEVQTLLTTGPITEHSLGQAIEMAAAANHPDLVQVLLESGPISARFRDRALRDAADAHRQDIVQALLQARVSTDES